MFRRLKDIPKIFYSEETEQPFDGCIDCGEPLFLDESEYTVQKVFVRDEAVFEFAICHKCSMNMSKDFSEETIQAYSEFFSQLDGSRRLDLIINSEEHEFDDWIVHCMVCAKARSECHRFSLCGRFAGSELVLAEFPAIICDECEQKVGELTSKKTRDRMDRFMEENFDGPPGIGLDSPFNQPILM